MQIIFEDNYIICVNKPAMVLSQVSFNKDRKPVQTLLEEVRPDLKGHLYLHHRLDFETSGVFLLSKSKQANAPLTEMFKTHQVEKVYVCLARPNELKPGKKVECDILNENGSEWIIKNYMAPAKGMGHKKTRMISVKSGGWLAETHFKILQSNQMYHFIQCTPKTGRTHQIRQHLQESYRSILGDNIYGGKSSDVPRLMLHAFQLNFPHPITKELIKVEAPLPNDIKKILDL
ncbi:MAG: RluA family pseudouridine synthase [Pseudobdellovibrio sp.]